MLLQWAGDARLHSYVAQSTNNPCKLPGAKRQCTQPHKAPTSRRPAPLPHCRTDTLPLPPACPRPSLSRFPPPCPPGLQRKVWPELGIAAVMLGCHFLGALVYATHWPQRFFPGVFDLAVGVKEGARLPGS